MICSVDNNQVIEKILKSSTRQIKKFLSEQDQKYIIWRKNQIIENMPYQLKPNTKVQQKSVSTLLKNIIQQHSQKKKISSNKIFPSMFQQKCNQEYYKTVQKFSNNFNNKNYDNKSVFQRNLENIDEYKNINKLGYQTQHQEIQELNKIANQQILKNLQTVKLIPQNNSVPANITPLPQQNNILGEINQKSFNQSQKQISINKFNPNPSKNPFLLLPQKHSPFIANQNNFLDIHSNKKSAFQSYISPQTTSMNLLQYNQLKKQQNIFEDGYSYPNAVMGGVGVGIMKTSKQMRTNPFSKTFASGNAGCYNTLERKQQGLNYQNNQKVSRKPQLQQVNKSQQQPNNLYLSTPNNLYNHKQNQNYQQQHNPQFNNSNNPQIQSTFHEQVIQNVLKYTLNDKRYVAHTRIQQRVGRGDYQVNNNMSTISRMIGGKDENNNNNQIYPINNNKKQRVLQNPFVRRPNSQYKR